MKCRSGCAACCIAVSINSPLPGMPGGKPAGERCINLDTNNFCTIHKTTEYPPFCGSLQASDEMCGDKNDHAFEYLVRLEKLTR